MYKESEPKLVVSDNLHGETYEHPSYGMLQASRVSGRSTLYGSDFVHNTTIRLTISEGDLKRSLSNDWAHRKDQLIEIEMSEAQWATFVSSLNMGSGTQCTLRRVMGERRDRLPEPVTRTSQFKQEFYGKVGSVVKALEDASDKVEGLKSSKKSKSELQSAIAYALREIKSNMPFVAEQFDEHMETTTDCAKAEIHGHMVNVLTKLGINSMTEMPLVIDHDEQNLIEGDPE